MCRWAVSFIANGGVKALADSLSFYDKKTVKTDTDLEFMAELLRCALTANALQGDPRPALCRLLPL